MAVFLGRQTELEIGLGSVSFSPPSSRPGTEAASPGVITVEKSLWLLKNSFFLTKVKNRLIENV
jgi:hypothetical protein